MRPQDDSSALHARTDADAATRTTRVDPETATFVETLTRLFEAGRADAKAETERLKALLVKARMDLEAAKADLTAERESSDTLREEVARMTGVFDRALDEMRREHAAVLAEQAAACTALPLDELLTVFHSLAGATTSQELLRALQAGLAREFSRVALFHIDGARLVATDRRGFSDEDTSKPIHLLADSLLTRAMSTCQLESIIVGREGESRTGLPFGGTPGCALALPIVENGAMAGVIYADDSDHVEFASNAPHARIKFAELVHHYAVLLMLRISVEGTDSQDLRGFAASLVAQLEYNYTVEAEAGRNRVECQQRLKAALQAARRRYAQRAGDEAEASGLLDEQLASAAAAKKETTFGRDLEAVMGSGRADGGRGDNVVAINRSR